MLQDGKSALPSEVIESLRAEVETLKRRNAELEHATASEREPSTDELRRLEERYRELVELAPMGVVIHAEGRIVLLNAEGARILGVSCRDELLGTPILGIVHPDDQAMVSTMMQSRTRTALAPARFLRADGTVVHIEAAGSPMRYQDRQARQVVFADVSERHSVVEELSKLRAAVETSGEIVFLTDPSGVITYVNPEFTRVYGWTAPETIGRVTPRILKSGQVTAEEYAVFWRRIVDREFVVGEYANRAKSGRLVWVEASASPILDGSEQIVGFLALHRDITERKARERQQRFVQLTVEHGGDTALWFEPDGCIAYANQKACTSLGYAREELVGSHLSRIDPALSGETWPRSWAHLEAARTVILETTHRAKDGHEIPIEMHATYVEFDGKPYGLSIARDITERRELAAQLHHAQKMEAVGRLAGGVAHDFNNLLSVILSFSQMISEDLEDSDPIKSDLAQIELAAQRAATVARQLPLFSRREVVEQEIVELNGVVVELEKLLHRILGEDIVLLTVPGANLWSVEIGVGHMEQVLANLAVNAKDAMPDGGQLVITTNNLVVERTGPLRALDLAPGRYVRIEVRDTGAGMTPETAARAFEPFFTTKSQGKGTGLGLSIVYGIITQAGGRITLRSAPKKGTTFEIVLPAKDRVAESPSASPTEATYLPLTGAGQTILVVEDEDGVRTAAARLLHRAGYKVELARNAGEAILTCERLPIDLLLTDVIMPMMSGFELAARLMRDHPNLPVLFMSGYPGDVAALDQFDAAAIDLLPKPFGREALLRRVAEALNRRD